MEQSLCAHLLLVSSATYFSAKDDNYCVNGYCSSDRSTHSHSHTAVCFGIPVIMIFTFMKILKLVYRFLEI